MPLLSSAFVLFLVLICSECFPVALLPRRKMALPLSPTTVFPSDPTTSLINSLLKRMVQLAASLSGRMKRSNNNNNNNNAPNSLNSSTISLSFSTSHKINIPLQEHTYAYRYLALPASAYSLLNSSLITRKEDSESLFTFSLNLAEVSSVLPPSLFLPAMLSTDIEVDTSRAASLGEIKMASSPLVLSAVNVDAEEEHFVQTEEGEYELGENSPQDLAESDRKLRNSADFQESFFLPQTLLTNSSLFAKLMQVEGSDRVLSPFQSAFKIDLKWNPNEFDMLSSRNEDGSNTTVLVKAQVNIKFGVRLETPSEVASVVNFPPMKLLIEQICGLTSKSVLSTIAPQLSALLIQDFEKRKALWVAAKESALESTAVTIDDEGNKLRGFLIEDGA